MCEQTPVEYKDGDIVWVKLGPCWWPGEVQDFSKLPPEWRAEFKKLPIAAVKFFEEDAYEYVKTIDKIYSYNCTKKNEFIKKGLDLYRAKNSFMDKFPADVATAERRTNGDPNIIDSPLFSSEKKTNFAALLFGTPKAKKSSKKTSIGTKRLSTSTNISTPSSSKTAPKRTSITHPRFLGYDDHEVRILLQAPDKKEASEPEIEPSYNCSTCGFSTSRIDVIVLHNKSHIQGVYNTPTSTSKRGKKSPPKKGKKIKMARSKTSSIMEDLELLEKGIDISTESTDEEMDDDSDDFDDEPKRKRKKNKRKPKKVVPPKKEQEIKTDIRVDLLAEWEEDNSDEQEGGEGTALNTSSTAESDTSISKVDESSSSKTEDSKKEVDKSCFDFEEEEEENEIIGTSVGRKIPRVIPPAEKQKDIEDEEPDTDEAMLPSVIPETDKQKTVDPDIDEANLPTAEDDIHRSEHIKEISDVISSEHINEISNIISSVSDTVSSVTVKDLDIINKGTAEASTSEEKMPDPDEEAFKDILQSTAVPELPEIPHALKCEQNFLSTETIKFPDKQTTEAISEEKAATVTSKHDTKDASEATTKLINPKKRFVKSFEDFEMQWNNEHKKVDELEEKQNNDDTNKLTESEDKLSNEQHNSPQLEQLPVDLEEKQVESEKELEQESTTIVEVSKLKTQLMSKLENYEKLKPLEHIKIKKVRGPRRSRLVRDKMLKKQKDEDVDDFVLPKRLKVDSSLSSTSAIEELVPLSQEFDEPVKSASSQHETDVYASSTEIEEDTEQINLDIFMERSTLDKEIQNDIFDTDGLYKTSTSKSRRLSVKMPEVKETSDTEQTGELSELHENRVVAMEQAQVKEVKQNLEMLKVQQVVTETPSIELQTSNGNQMNVVLNQDETCCETIEDVLHKPNKELDSESKNETKIDIESENEQIIQETEPEISKANLVEAPEKEEFSKTFATSMELGTKHSDMLRYSIADLNKEMAELISIQFSNDSSESNSIKGVESEMSSQVAPTSISFSLENQNTNTKVVENENSEDLSALTTLAAVSELTTNLDMERSSHDEKSKIIEGNLAKVSNIPISVNINISNNEKSKMVEGNLTFVTEDDLADGQVEIANVSTNVNQNKSKPITLSNFSVDFGDLSQSTTNNSTISTDTNITTKTNKRKHTEDTQKSEIIEKSLEKVFEEDIYGLQPNMHSSKNIKLMSTAEKAASEKKYEEAQTPSLIVHSSKHSDMKSVLSKKTCLGKAPEHPEYTSSSKLLEILTDGKPKTVQSKIQESSNTVEVHRKIEPKVSTISTTSGTITSKYARFVIKSAMSPKANVNMPISKSNNRPIILSEKIIKPVSETDTVSVQRVTSKIVDNQNVEDIDAFIIQKPLKKLITSPDNDTNENTPVPPIPPTTKKSIAPRGKAKILQQTIIKPAGEVAQPISTTLSTALTTQPLDDNMFDINSMPIVLGDQILTAESIENMPVVLSDSLQSTSTKNISTATTTVVVSKPQTEQVKLLNKSSSSVMPQPVLVKTYSSQKLAKSSRLYPAGTTKIVKSNPAIVSRTGKTDKFIIVPPGSSSTSGSKYTVGKRPPIMKRSTPVILPTPASSATKVQNVQSSEPTGNKIMIVTNQQGQQSRVLLTPAQQKLLGYQPTGSKLVKSTLKGNILQKVSNTKTSNISSFTNVSSKVPTTLSHAIVNSKGEILSTAGQNLITSDGQVLMPVKSTQIRGLKTDTPKGGKRIQMQSQKVLLHEGLSALKNSPIPAQQKTIVIRNQQGQIVKQFHGTDDAILEAQVAEQVQAIKASGSFSSMKAKQEIGTSKIKPAVRRSYTKKIPIDAMKTTSKPQMILNTGNVAFASPKLQKPDTSVPPLAPISQVPQMDEIKIEASASVKEAAPKTEQIQQKPVNQLIIQDALGNQTTITEGQILALPSGETIDGQPQSYMLVTLDESGNLAPLNNEALLSLDPNLCLGGDLSNMVLQIDDGSNAAKQDTSKMSKASDANINTTNAVSNEVPESQNVENAQREKQQPKVVMPAVQEQIQMPAVQEQIYENKPSVLENATTVTNQSTLLETSQQNLEAVQTVTCSIGNDPNQQLIITGDPISTQKFIESLTEGNPDLANLLASAEGNILIQTDEQQILINTDAENSMLLPVNATENLGVIENTESNSNPIFAAQPSKSQDILAAALADTDVFQQEQTSPVHTKALQSQLSPNGGLYPSGVANVLGTTLTLSSPIMTPLEVPSSNNKKIPDEESDILTTEVPKNVDLPITITDPNISQTVAQQQVASLIASELTSNLELPLTISDQGVPLTSADMNSPTYVYSLPTLDETVDIHPKTFSGPISMPLLNEEPQETSIADDMDSKTEVTEKATVDKEEATPISDVESDLRLNSVSDSTSSSLFGTSSLSANDSIKDSERLQTTNRAFLSEGLCALEGAMCSSLSEPPPDMFDIAITDSNYVTDTEIKEHIDSNTTENDIVSNVSESTTSRQSKPIDCDMNLCTNEQSSSIEEDYNKFDNYDTDCRNDGTPLSNIPLNSESSSPAVNIDENSCEIPVQPQIVTDLSSSSFDTHETADSADFDTNKRTSSDDSIENEKKKSKFD